MSLERHNVWNASLLSQILQDELNGLQPQINYVKDFVDMLVSDATSIGDTSRVTADIDDIMQRYAELSEGVVDRLAKMEVASETISNFQVRGTTSSNTNNNNNKSIYIVP